MAKTFTKIRKWSEQVGATVIGDSESTDICVILPNQKTFDLTIRESSAYRTWRGEWAGDPAGIYMSRRQFPPSYSLYYYSQTQCIQRMELSLETVS